MVLMYYSAACTRENSGSGCGGIEMKLNLYEQSGSDNHGCEAIIRATIDMFRHDFESIELFSSLPESEYQYGLDQVCNVHLQGEAIRTYSLSAL